MMNELSLDVQISLVNFTLIHKMTWSV